MTQDGLKTIGLFSGVGGVELGFARAGFQTTALSEIEPAVRAVLTNGFPDVELLGDIREIRSLPPVDLVTAGFPCQDISPAGRKAGIGGERSGLINEVFRLLEDRSVDRVVLENVTGILTSGRGYAMEVVVSGLERLGYHWAYRTVDMRAFGLPQRRRRVFFYASRIDDPRDVLLSMDHAFVEPALELAVPLGFYWTEGRESASMVARAVPTIKAGSSKGFNSAPALLMPDGMLGMPDIRDLERLQGFDEGWTEPVLSVDRHGRQKAVGNAVPPPASAWLASAILDHGRYAGTEDVEMVQGGIWPKAAYNVGGGRRIAPVGAFPVLALLPCISQFLRHPLRPLSSRAASGFAKRARAGCARFPDGFIDAMDRHAREMEVAA